MPKTLQHALAAVLIALIGSQVQSALAQAPPQDATPAAKESNGPAGFDLSGLVDMYYQYSFNRPPAGVNLMGRAWDVKHDSFTFTLLELTAKRAPTKEVPVGITAVLNVGKTADLVHMTEPGTKTIRFLQQAYLTIPLARRTNTTLDVGKFQAWACYDQIDPTSTDNYSRSLLYMLGEPFYHVGLRLTTDLSREWMGYLYLVNGWNNAEEDNGGKTIGASLMYMPKIPFTFMLSYIGGDEGSDTVNSAGMYGGAGFMMPGVLNVQMLNFNAAWTPGRWKVAFNTDYASASKPGMMGGHWNGQSLVVRYQINPAWAVAVRPEHFEDSDGLRTGAGQNLNSLTATLERKWHENAITRLEYRHDHAGSMFFPTKNGMSNNQDTITVAQLFRF